MLRAPDTDRLVLSTARRLLTLADTDPISPTFGCFDRDYWHHKAVKDFPGATYQMALLPLAMLYRTPFPGNDFAGEPFLLRIVLGAMRFWARIQRPSGAVDEWFPGEYSQVATAASSYAVAEAIRTLTEPGPGCAPREMFADLFPSLKRAARWLASHPTEWVSNHRASAVAALETIAVLTQTSSFRDAARSELAALLARQDPEGWFPEYGSSDPGYLGITCGWLARYHLLSRDMRAREALDRALAFLGHFLTPGGVFAGPVGARDTTYLLLTGPLLAPRECPSARPLAARCLDAVRKGQLAASDSVEDRYLAFSFGPDVVQALLLGDDPGAAVPLEPHCRHLPRAGLLSVRSEALHTVVGLAKGGVLVAGSVASDRTILWDSGWQIVDATGATWTSSWPGSSQVFALVLDPAGESSVEIDGPFLRMDYSRPLEQLVIPFRCFTALFADSEFVMAPFSRWIKGRRLL
ncbi:MAG: hypothetical protein HY815_30350 [Candidatus Riflebacteria bacterium]|nr:hypothetical protein [Candidatus Riflebacteria bacterium]